MGILRRITGKGSIILLLLFWVTGLYAQTETRVSGKVIDAKTRKPLPFVNVIYVGTTIGTMTDINGKYTLATRHAAKQLQTSCLGYITQHKTVKQGSSQIINFHLKQKDIELHELEVKAKRTRYRNKNNPAVALIRKVIENKNLNRIGDLGYYQYDKYEKDEFDLNNISIPKTPLKFPVSS